MFFDKADAFFGSCTGVKDSRDHYANLELELLGSGIISGDLAKRRGGLPMLASSGGIEPIDGVAP